MLLTAGFAALFMMQPQKAEAYVDGIYNPNTDKHPTTEQLASLGYYLEANPYRFYSDTSGATASFYHNYSLINYVDYNNGYAADLGLFHKKNGVTYRCLVYTVGGSSVETEFLYVPNTDTTSNRNFNYWRIPVSGNMLSVGDPIDLSLLWVDADDGRIYFTYYDINLRRNISFYLGENGLTDDKNQATPVTKKVAPPTAQNFTYDGTQKTGVLAGEGYTLSGTTTAIAAGNYTAVATLQSGYVWNDGTSNAKTISWSISALGISGASVSVPTQTYTGSALTPVPTVTLNGKTLVYGTDFTCEWTNNTDAGTGYVKVIGKGNYSGETGTAAFTISQKSMAGISASVSGSFVYNGSGHTPKPVVKDGTTQLVKDRDYTLS